MLNEILSKLFERDLNKLAEELNAYPDENKIWAVQTGISNSAGNLALHLIGNLNHFVGADLGHTGYVRDRESEFTLKNIPRAELVANIEKTKAVVIATIGKLSEADFAKTFPLKMRGEEITTAYMLTHLISHLSYHLGQINYHRRLLG